MLVFRFLFFAMALSLLISTGLYLFTGKPQYLQFVKNTFKLFIALIGTMLVVIVLERLGF